MHKNSQTEIRRIVVLGTGGTISGGSTARSDNIGYTTGEIDVQELFAHITVPEGFVLHAEQIAQMDSKDMDFATWQTLARRCTYWLDQSDVAGIVITHGTDTLEETAFFLGSVLVSGKPVVLTCSMRPATAFAPDGPQNMRDALVVVATPGASGVVAVCAGVVHSAQDVQKVHTYRLDAFSSGDMGPVAYVEESAIRLVRTWAIAVNASPSTAAALKIETENWPCVEILMSYAGARGAMVDALIQPSVDKNFGVVSKLKIDGLVIASTGNGTIHSEMEVALLRAQAAGITVVRATRCTQGRILKRQQEAFRDAGSLTPVKARIALILELLSRKD